MTSPKSNVLFSVAALKSSSFLAVVVVVVANTSRVVVVVTPVWIDPVVTADDLVS